MIAPVDIPKSGSPRPEAAPAEPDKPGALVVGDAGIATVEGIRLDEHYSTENYRHLDMTFLTAALGNSAWARLKFKFSLSRSGRALEFRKAKGWPNMFEVWPGTDEDEYGQVMRMADDAETASQIRGWRVPKDRALIDLVMLLLPEAAESAARQANRPEAEVTMWRDEAAKFAANLRNGMQDGGADASSGAKGGDEADDMAVEGLVLDPAEAKQPAGAKRAKRT
jgi:hypothetical protein